MTAVCFRPSRLCLASDRWGICTPLRHGCCPCKCSFWDYTNSIIRLYTVSGKKETKMFSVISPTTFGQFWWNLASRFLNKFAATWCTRFPPHLNNVSTLPCKTWNAHRARATMSWYRKKLQNLSHRNCGLQIRQIWIQLITECGKYRNRRCKKYASLM